MSLCSVVGLLAQQLADTAHSEDYDCYDYSLNNNKMVELVI